MKKRKRIGLIVFGWLAVVALLASCVSTKMAEEPPKLRIQSVVPLIVVNGPPPETRRVRGFRMLSVTNPLVLGSNYSMAIFSPSGGPTNLTVRAYYSRSAPHLFNAVYPSNSSAYMGTNYFEPVSGFFTGVSSVALATNDWAFVDFQLRAEAFDDANRGSGFITFVGRGTSGTNTYEMMFVYPVESPY
jgi:hypothetical protein